MKTHKFILLILLTVLFFSCNDCNKTKYDSYYTVNAIGISGTTEDILYSLDSCRVEFVIIKSAENFENETEIKMSSITKDLTEIFALSNKIISEGIINPLKITEGAKDSLEVLRYRVKLIEEKDYRDPYLGLFNFTTIKSVIVTMDSIYVLNCDTTIYKGNVLKKDAEKIEIKFQENSIGFDQDNNPINPIFPYINENGRLIFGYPYESNYKFGGYYSEFDTLIINIEERVGMGGYNYYEIV
ncbi:hypothetical protein LJC69_06560, partial [Bacteroidales bacterium OttesenSCG-928-K22]|nr:hypothetical protein [Bacteroidales bacterium OttesenSCG-928-K22]